MIRSDLRGLRLVDRTDFLRQICGGRRLLHLGATDAPETAAAIREGRFLHEQLRQVASSVVGMDNNEAMIDFLRQHHGIEDIRFGDIEIAEDYPAEAFDLVVAGEILEHLSNPGRALDALRARLGPETLLIVTVPNAYSLKGFLRALAGLEWIHPDHVLHHSLRTLSALLSRHGFAVEQSFGFVNAGAGLAAGLANRLLRLVPQLAEGVGVVCRPSPGWGGSTKPP
ncbi:MULTISPECIES: class I SAM-dependent methyltransferase [unclassified Thiocapsa]|uniref:class I SAM-dependent methyltransferase n=1 Tax=unclassified Thiocapsa TaxID=2641286 RepID=UPI0035AFD08F